MFHAARLKLTAWYLLIIMLISISFSIVMYRVLTVELDRIEHIQASRQQHIKEAIFFKEKLSIPRGEIVATFLLDPKVIEEAKQRLAWRLFAINFGILALSGLAGYFLAGRTLRPIQEMVDEQNQFITDASHELRTPLTSLRTELEVAIRNKDLSQKETKELMQSNLEEVVHLQQLSDNLLALAQHKKNHRKQEKVSLLMVVERALKKMVPLARKKQMIIVNQIDDYAIEGDAQSLTELFVILIDNAIKYSDPQKKVILDSKKTAKQVIVTLVDEGMGIEKKDLPYIFDRFYRADSSRSKQEKDGYGLGLSIAQEIVEAHGGSIGVTSTIGKGTTFTLRFPIKEARKA